MTPSQPLAPTVSRPAADETSETSAIQTLARLNGAAERLWEPLCTALQARQVSAGTPQDTGFTLEVVASIDSSNTELMRRARQGLRAPVLMVAVEQTAGRGRMGKTWVSQPGASLTFSLGLPMQPVSWSGLSLAVGVCLAEALAGLLPPPSGRALGLKWPNDLWLEGQKLAGILVETAHVGTHPWVVVGVGINIDPPPKEALQAAADSSQGTAGGWTGVAPTGLAAHAPGTDAADALATVAPALLNGLLAFEALGFAAFAQRFAARDVLQDQALALSDGTQGTGCGVDDSGALLVLTDSGMRAVNSADVSVRPQTTSRRSPPC